MQAAARSEAKDIVPQRSPAQLARLTGLRAVAHIYIRPRGDETPRNILLIRPDHLGDVLLLTPALHALREALPTARLTLLLGPWGAQAVQGNPEVEAVELCEFPGFERKPKRNSMDPYRRLFEAAAGLKGRFDTAVVLRYDHWWGAWLAAAAAIPRRIGYDWPETRPFLTEPVTYAPGRHEALQNARLLDALAPGVEADLGPSRYVVQPEDAAWAREQLGQGRWLAIHAGSGAAVKQYPVESWAEVARALHETQGVSILLTGGPAERELAGAIAARIPFPALDLSGRTTFGQLAAVYSQCTAVLGSDSGPLHLAVASGAKTVTLYGPVPAEKFGPWGNPTRNVVLRSPFACVPCDRLDWPAEALPLHGCMAAIPPHHIIDAALRLLE